MLGVAVSNMVMRDGVATAYGFRAVGVAQFKAVTWLKSIIRVQGERTV